MRKAYNNPITNCTDVRLTTVLCNSIRNNVNMNYGGGAGTDFAM